MMTKHIPFSPPKTPFFKKSDEKAQVESYYEYHKPIGIVLLNIPVTILKTKGKYLYHYYYHKNIYLQQTEMN